MQRELLITKDGSHTIAIPEMNLTYHSIHGAIQESIHVFINAGLLHSGLFETIGVHSILEIGFGTGLNALLSLIEADKHQNRLYYTALETNPLEEQIIQQLNYCEQLNEPSYQEKFERMHECGWEEMYEISQFFRLTKKNTDLAEISYNEEFNIIYFDAFAPNAQPALWTEEIFRKLYSALTEEGILVTYCSKADVRRAMIAAGFTVEKIPGPQGKREMLRAVRPGGPSGRGA